MKRNLIELASIAGCFLLFSACAGNPAPVSAAGTPASAVIVNVTGDRDINDAFTREIRTASLRSITRYIPNARPMTVALVLDSSLSGVTLVPSVFSPRESRILGTSTNASQVGALPTVEVHPITIAGSMARADFGLRGRYSIADADGRLIESKPFEIRTTADNRDGNVGIRRDLVMLTGEFVASRVKALNH